MKTQVVKERKMLNQTILGKKWEWKEYNYENEEVEKRLF